MLGLGLLQRTDSNLSGDYIIAPVKRMATMISEVYEAFRSAGIPDERARAAAEALSSENVATKRDINELKATQKLHSWMIGFNLAITMAIFWKLFS